MKRIALFLLCLPLAVLAQNARYSAPFPSVSSQYTTPFVVANVPPNSPIPTVCNSPANAVPCTNYATTYTSAGVACPNGAQDTPDPNPSVCQSTGDAQGNIAFWAPPGKYDYTVCIENSTSCFGPYTVVLSTNGNPIRGLSFSIYNASGLTSGTTSASYDLITVPFSCTLQAYNLLVDTGTITVKFWKVATGTAIPTNSNSISTSGVSIASGTAIHSTTLTDFTTTSVAANDILAMDITAVSGANLVNGVLQCQ